MDYQSVIILSGIIQINELLDKAKVLANSSKA